MSRAREAFAKIPLATLFFGAICCATYCFQIFWNPKNHEYTMNPRQVLFMHQYYRIITSAFFHGSLMHIGMNMLSFFPMGTSLEKSLGSLWMAFTISWSILLTSAVYLSVAFASYVCGSETLFNQHSLGFSGVLFHLLVLECSKNPNASHSIFGMMQVSSKAYPWVLLVVIQFLMPNISFLGHLSGILCGTLQASGHLNSIMPSAEYLRSCDESQRLHFITSKASFVKTAPSERFAIFSNSSRENAIVGGAKFVAKFVRNVVETIKVVIFGRGNTANENIRFTEEATALNEDEWVGLPRVAPPKEIPHEAEMV